jgi:hypothetical protein
MHPTTRYHAAPAVRSALAAGRWFEGANALGRAVAWAQRTATGQRLPMAVWRVCPAGPVRLKLVRRIEPNPLPV